MKLRLSSAEREALERFLAGCEDAEMLKENEWVLDLYDISAPVSIDMVFEKSGDLRIDGAATLLYDEEQDGWYMGARLEDAGDVRAALEQAGALSK